MDWSGTIVASLYRVERLKDEPVYLIECDDGDRIWRYESELEFKDKELERRFHGHSKSRNN